MSEFRRLLEQSSDAWLSGDRHRTWTALEQAAALAGDDTGLKAEVEARRSAALLRAEREAEAVEAAERCLHLAEGLAEHSAELNGAVAHARVSLASARALLDRSPENIQSCLADLERLVEDPDPALEKPQARAVSNTVLIHINELSGSLGHSAAEVEAWSRLSWARALTRDFSDQGTIVRQAVDLAFLTGQWERGWDFARLAENSELPRDEQVAIWAKTAVLAWERGSDDHAREFGRKSLSATAAVSIPWVRIYGYLGGVVASAAGAGPVKAALDAYQRCVTVQEHATRPHRVLHAGLIALEAQCAPEVVRGFIRRTLPGFPADLNQCGAGEFGLAMLVEATLREAEFREQDPEVLGAALPSGIHHSNRARLHLMLARMHLRSSKRMSALTELHQARQLLTAWPGRVLNTVERETAKAFGPLSVTPAQRKVLDLLVEGWGNRRIAEHLRISERTVAVHVAAMLKHSGAVSRTELVAQEMARRLSRP